MTRFDLRSLRFDERDEAWRLIPVDLGPFVLGGLEYAVPGGVVDLELTAARVGDRLTLSGSLETVLEGPCQRCLGAAQIPVQARDTEVVRHGRSEGVEPEEAYVDGHMLLADAWVRDLIAAGLPAKLLCREQCRGLCPVCGADLNVDPGHSHP